MVVRVVVRVGLWSWLLCPVGVWCAEEVVDELFGVRLQ